MKSHIDMSYKHKPHIKLEFDWCTLTCLEVCSFVTLGNQGIILSWSHSPGTSCFQYLKTV